MAFYKFQAITLIRLRLLETKKPIKHGKLQTSHLISFKYGLTDPLPVPYYYQPHLIKIVVHTRDRTRYKVVAGRAHRASALRLFSRIELSLHHPACCPPIIPSTPVAFPSRWILTWTSTSMLAPALMLGRSNPYRYSHFHYRD